MGTHEENCATIKKRVQADIDTRRQELETWAKSFPPFTVSVTEALLELGMDREIELLGITDAKESLDKMFERRAEKYRRSLQ